MIHSGMLWLANESAKRQRKNPPPPMSDGEILAADIVCYVTLAVFVLALGFFGYMIWNIP